MTSSRSSNHLWRACWAWCTGKPLVVENKGFEAPVLPPGLADWLLRLEVASIKGDLTEFAMAPPGLARELSLREHALLQGPQIFGKRIMRMHPDVLLHFVESGWWSRQDLGRFIEQTCHFGSPYFMSGFGGALRDVPVSIVGEWSRIILGQFGLSVEHRRTFVGHLAASMRDEDWANEGHFFCRGYTGGIEMDVLLAVARRTRPDWVALEMHSSLDQGLRSIVWPVIDMARPLDCVFAPYSGVCPELDLQLGGGHPFTCNQLYAIGVRLKTLQRAQPESYPLPNDE